MFKENPAGTIFFCIFIILGFIFFSLWVICITYGCDYWFARLAVSKGTTDFIVAGLIYEFWIKEKKDQGSGINQINIIPKIPNKNAIIISTIAFFVGFQEFLSFLSWESCKNSMPLTFSLYLVGLMLPSCTLFACTNSSPCFVIVRKI